MTGIYEICDCRLCGKICDDRLCGRYVMTGCIGANLYISQKKFSHVEMGLTELN